MAKRKDETTIESSQFGNFKEFLSSQASKKDPMPDITTTIMQYPTGFMYLDYMAGSYSTVYDDETEKPIYTYHNVGITDGSVNVLISKSQGGKTSLAISMGSAIIEPWITKSILKRWPDVRKDVKDSMMSGRPFIEILDTEKTLPINYVKKIVSYTNPMLDKYVMINPITTDIEMMKCVEKHVNYKIHTMKKVCMPMNDIFDKPIYNYPPTILIIDSMSQLVISETDGVGTDVYEKMIQNTAGARRAKIISALYSTLVNYAKKYNIIIFSINHINKMPAMMGIPVKQYRGLRPGETIGGGERAIYLASTILRLDVIKSIGGQSASSVQLGDGVSGFIAIAKWIKSKSNSKDNSCQLVYTNRFGYDRLLSLLWYGKETGDLSRSGNFFYLDRYPTIKFTMKNAREVFEEHPEMLSALYTQFRDKCSSLLDSAGESIKNKSDVITLDDDDVSDSSEFSIISNDNWIPSGSQFI